MQASNFGSALTNFSFEFFYEIFTEDASQHLLYHGTKKSKMTKNSNQGGPALKSKKNQSTFPLCRTHSVMCLFESKPVCFFSFFVPCAAREVVGVGMEVDDTPEKNLKSLEMTYVLGQEAGASSLAKHKKIRFGTRSPNGKG